MAQYIDKDALVTKIDNLKHKIDDRYSYSNGWKDALCMVEAELDTLEVKEVDLEKEIEWEWVHREKQEVPFIECAEMDKDEFVRFARHFFELGLSVSNKTQKG